MSFNFLEPCTIIILLYPIISLIIYITLYIVRMIIIKKKKKFFATCLLSLNCCRGCDIG